MSTINSDLKTRLLQYYADTEILNQRFTIDADDDKIYKLLVLSNLYDSKIFEDLMLLHTFEKMYGSKVLRDEILHVEGDIPLDVGYFDEDFGYNISEAKFYYQTCAFDDSVLKLQVRTGPMKPQGMLDGLEFLSSSTTNKDVDFTYIGKHPNYAFVTVGFINRFINWSEDFHRILDKWLYRHEKDFETWGYVE